MSLNPSQDTPNWRKPKQHARLKKSFHRDTIPPPGDDATDGTRSAVTDSSPAVMADSSVPGGAPPTSSVSFCPVSHQAMSFSEDAGFRPQSSQSPSLSLLHAVRGSASPPVNEVLHTSFPDKLGPMRDIIPQPNGFVFTALEAYNNHRKLIIRPDDVWLSIMTQFSFFVNGSSESLRKTFVAHEGKRELVVFCPGNRYSMNVASVTNQMTKLIERNIKDPSLREWVMPNFTTTKELDKTTCAIVLMGMMKNYFTYRCEFVCGIPKVTLEGEKQDWETILTRIEQLKKYGIQTTAWYHLLRPIITRFVKAYDEPNHPDNLKFWKKIAHYEPYGCGSEYLSGWITAFCVFDEKGSWQGDTLNEEAVQEPETLHKPADPLGLTPSKFAARYMKRRHSDRTGPYLTLDGFPYPKIDSGEVPCGYVSVDLLLDDHGSLVKSMLFAGSVGSQICSTEKSRPFRDTVRPVTGWWLAVMPEEEKSEATLDDGE